VFKLVLPALLVLVVLYSAVGVWRAWKLRDAPRRRTWALFVGRGPRGRLLVRRVQKADPTATVAVYRLRSDAALAESLGVEEQPTLVLGDGAGGVKVRLVGRKAIELYLHRRG